MSEQNSQKPDTATAQEPSAEARQLYAEIGAHLRCHGSEVGLLPKIAAVISSATAELQQQLADTELAFTAANQIVEKLQEDYDKAIARAERAEAALSIICERHLDTTLSDANINDNCPLCEKERAEAKEVQLRNHLITEQGARNHAKDALKDCTEVLQAITSALAEPQGGEYHTARKVADKFGIYHDDLEGGRVLLRIAEHILAEIRKVTNGSLREKKGSAE